MRSSGERDEHGDRATQLGERAMATDDEKQLIRKLWGEGLSDAQIAPRLATLRGRDVTRNVVIGIRNRLGIVRDGRAPRQNRGANAKRAAGGASKRRPRSPFANLRAAFRYAAAEPLPLADVPTGPLVALDDLEEHSCRWPFGDPKQGPFGFCGARKVTGLPYCEPHARRAYESPAQRAARIREVRERAAQRSTAPHRAAPISATEETVA